MLDFYQAVASLLPVLVLAAVIEFGRLRRPERPRALFLWLSLFNYLLFFAIAIAGETLALTVLRRGEAFEAADQTIEVALVASVFLLMLPALVDQGMALAEATGSKLLLWALGIAMFVAMVGALLAVSLT